MEQSPSLETNGSSASQNIPRIYCNPEFIIVFTESATYPCPEPDQFYSTWSSILRKFYRTK